MTGAPFSFCAVAFTSVASTVVDALSPGLFQPANTSVDDSIRRVIEVSEPGAMYNLRVYDPYRVHGQLQHDCSHGARGRCPLVSCLYPPVASGCR